MLYSFRLRRRLYSPPGVELEELTIWERSRFYLIYGILRNRANFSKNPTIRACEQLQEFCEHEQASTSLNFASKSSKGQILRVIENFYDHSIPLRVGLETSGVLTGPSIKQM